MYIIRYIFLAGLFWYHKPITISTYHSLPVHLPLPTVLLLPFTTPKLPVAPSILPLCCIHWQYNLYHHYQPHPNTLPLYYHQSLPTTPNPFPFHYTTCPPTIQHCTAITFNRALPTPPYHTTSSNNNTTCYSYSTITTTLYHFQPYQILLKLYHHHYYQPYNP